MINANIIRAVFINYAKDTKKNRKSMLAFVLIPVLAYLMQFILGDTTHKEHLSMIFMYLGMHCTLIPIMSSASAVAQDKEKNTLRAMMMNGVSPFEYLIGVSAFNILLTVAFSSLFVIMAADVSVVGRIYLAALLCSMISTLIGLTIGAYAQNMTAATSLTMVIGLPLMLLTAYSNISPALEKYANVLYNKQAMNVLADEGLINGKSLFVIGCNFIIVIILFVVAFQKTKFDD